MCIYIYIYIYIYSSRGGLREVRRHHDHPEVRATLDVPKPQSGGLVKKVGPFSKRTNPL